MEKLVILNANNQSMEVDVIRYFGDGSNNYFVFSLNELDAQGHMNIYVTKIVDQDGSLVGTNIIDDVEWSNLKVTLQKIIKENRTSGSAAVPDLPCDGIANVKVLDRRALKLLANSVEMLGMGYGTSNGNAVANNDSVVNEQALPSNEENVAPVAEDNESVQPAVDDQPVSTEDYNQDAPVAQSEEYVQQPVPVEQPGEYVQQPVPMGQSGMYPQQPMMQPEMYPQQSMMQPGMYPQQPMMQPGMYPHQPMMQPEMYPQQPMMQPDYVQPVPVEQSMDQDGEQFVATESYEDQSVDENSDFRALYYQEKDKNDKLAAENNELLAELNDYKLRISDIKDILSR